MPDRFALIVAGGSGTRMGSDMPKQFLCIGGRPVLMWTIELFSYCRVRKQVVVLPEEYFSFWEELCKKYDFKIPHKLVKGGSERFFSVNNGLKETPDNCLVAVHDGVRPFASVSVIEEAFSEAGKTGCAVPSVEIKDSVRMVGQKGNTPFPRNSLRIIQTPQIFKSELIKDAYRQPFSEEFTDDATVVEKYGVSIKLINGNYENIKITTPEDIETASYLVKKFPL